MKIRMMIRPLAGILTLLLAQISAGNEVGRTLNWQTVGSPNYVDQNLVARQAAEDAQPTGFALPRLAADESAAAQPRPVSLSRAPSVFVRSIELEGATVFPRAELEALFAPYLDRQVAMEDLQDLRLALSRKYVNAGYVNSGVIIPDQTVDGGRIVLRAVEGSLVKIAIDGDPKLAHRYIRGRLERRIDAPLNIADVKDSLQNLQRDPHVQRIDARLVPGDRPGTGVLHVQVQEAPRFEIGLSADNHHASSAGAERGRLTLSASNLTGYGEVLSLTGALSEGTDEYSAAFEVPITTFDTKLRAYYSTSDSDIIERTFKDLDIKSKTETRGIALSQPIIDNLADTVSVTLGFEAKSSETTLLGRNFSFSPGAQNGEADTSVALLGLDWIHRGDSHVTALRSTWRKGLDVLDATIFDPQTPLDALTNPTGADGEFDVIVTQGLFLKRLNSLAMFPDMSDRGQIMVRGTAQISRDPLMSLEKLAMGGANTVRGYPENLLVRDNGAALTFEVHLPMPGYTAEAGVRNLVFAPFIDIGTSWDDTDVDQVSSLRNTDDKRMIASAGLGLIWEPLAGLRAQLFWGHDVYDNFDDDDPRDSGSRDSNLQDDGVHFSVSYVRAW